MRRSAAKRTSVPKAFGKQSFPIVPLTDRHMHAGSSEMDAERPETSIFVHFSGKAQMRRCCPLLLEKAVIGHESMQMDRKGALSAFALYLRQSGGSR